MEFEEQEAVYGRDEYYWRTRPSSLAETTAAHLPEDPAGQRLVDVGAGEGRDAVLFAERGFDVVAVDVSPAGLEKAERLAGARGVEIATIRADANEFELAEPVDVVFSSGAVQYIRPEIRERQFGRLQGMTRPGGLHSMFAFVDHPTVPLPPDPSDDEHRFGREELQDYYEDWETLHSEEVVFDDDSGGEPHQHAARIQVARKPET